MGLKLFIFGIFLVLRNIEGKLELTNLKCDAYDKPFGDFAYCFLKSVNRSYKYLSVKVAFHQLPIKDIWLRIQLKKKENGYKPFLYDFTFDACKFLRNPNAGNLIIKYAYSFIKYHSNANHTCPMNHDLIFDKIDTNFLNDQFTKILPMPEGDYGVFVTLTSYKKRRGRLFVAAKIY